MPLSPPPGFTAEEQAARRRRRVVQVGIILVALVAIFGMAGYLLRAIASFE